MKAPTIFLRLIAFATFQIMITLVVVFLVTPSPKTAAGPTCVAGDVNNDGVVDVSDPILLLGAIFQGTPLPTACAQGQLTPSELSLLQDILSHTSVEFVDDGQGSTNKTIRFSGVNLQVVSGLGATNGYTTDPTSIDPLLTQVNGLGNIIIGYNEPGSPFGPDNRTGSHNLVIGSEHTYTSFGGTVVGQESQTLEPYASVSAGWRNSASAAHAAVTGGRNNEATAQYAAASGGRQNNADGIASSVSGGLSNTASGNWSSVSGGQGNFASGNESTVTGGQGNGASGPHSSVSGGVGSTASGAWSSVVGGRQVGISIDEHTGSGALQIRP